MRYYIATAKNDSEKFDTLVLTMRLALEQMDFINPSPVSMRISDELRVKRTGDVVDAVGRGEPGIESVIADCGSDIDSVNYVRSVCSRLLSRNYGLKDAHKSKVHQAEVEKFRRGGHDLFRLGKEFLTGLRSDWQVKYEEYKHLGNVTRRLRGKYSDAELRDWAYSQRSQHKLGFLSADKKNKLDLIKGWRWDKLPPRLSQNDIRTLIKMYKQGKNTVQLSAVFEMSSAAIGALLSREGVEKRNGKLSTEQIKTAAIMYRKGNDTVVIAKHFNVWPNCIKRVLIKQGCTMRSRFKLNQNKINKVSSMYKKGVSMEKLARLFNVAPSRIRNYLTIAGVSIRNHSQAALLRTT